MSRGVLPFVIIKGIIVGSKHHANFCTSMDDFAAMPLLSLLRCRGKRRWWSLKRVNFIFKQSPTASHGCWSKVTFADEGSPSSLCFYLSLPSSANSMENFGKPLFYTACDNLIPTSNSILNLLLLLHLDWLLPWNAYMYLKKFLKVSSLLDEVC